MPFPKAIADAQKRSIQQEIERHVRELIELGNEVSLGQPHLFSMTQLQYKQTLVAIGRAVMELKGAGK